MADWTEKDRLVWLVEHWDDRRRCSNGGVASYLRRRNSTRREDEVLFGSDVPEITFAPCIVCPWWQYIRIRCVCKTKTLMLLSGSPVQARFSCNNPCDFAWDVAFAIELKSKCHDEPRPVLRPTQTRTWDYVAALSTRQRLFEELLEEFKWRPDGEGAALLVEAYNDHPHYRKHKKIKV